MMWLLVTAALSQPLVDDPVEKAMQVLAKDPPVSAVQQAALDYFKVDASDVSGYRAAARLRALLPALTGSYTQDESNNLRLSTDRFQIQEAFDPDNPQVTDSASGVGRAYAASATWILAPLLFDPSELEAYALVGIQEDVVKEVTRLYYTRQHNVLAVLLDPPTDPRAKAGLILRTREIEAMLDAMTGGAWTRLKNAPGAQ